MLVPWKRSQYDFDSCGVYHGAISERHPDRTRQCAGEETKARSSKPLGLWLFPEYRKETGPGGMDTHRISLGLSLVQSWYHWYALDHATDIPVPRDFSDG